MWSHDQTFKFRCAELEKLIHELTRSSSRPSARWRGDSGCAANRQGSEDEGGRGGLWVIGRFGETAMVHVGKTPPESSEVRRTITHKLDLEYDDEYLSVTRRALTSERTGTQRLVSRGVGSVRTMERPGELPGVRVKGWVSEHLASVELALS